MDDAEKELIQLMLAFADFAEAMLLKHGEFYPYGAAMRPDKSQVSVAADVGEAHPASQTVIDSLNRAFAAGAALGQYDATALFCDAQVRPPDSDQSGDAIVVHLDHRAGLSTRAYIPYSLHRGGLLRRRRIDFGTRFSELGSFGVFQKPKASFSP